MIHISEINVKTEIEVLFLALKLLYALGLENNAEAYRSVAGILREYEYGGKGINEYNQ